MGLIWTYFAMSTSQIDFSFPVTVTVKQDTYTISPEKILSSYKSNHEEADIRLIFHALQSTTGVAVMSKDTDVLILMVCAYSKYEVKHKWYLKYDYDAFADIKLIVEYIGETNCL